VSTSTPQPARFCCPNSYRRSFSPCAISSSPKPTLNYPFEKGPISPRFRGEHALRRYPNGEERCIACKLVRAICPAQAINDRGRPAPQRRHPPHRALRHRHGEMHLLRPVPGSLSGRCHRRGPEFRIRDRDPRGLYYDKAKLLANGDRWEREIAKSIELDSPYR